MKKNVIIGVLSLISAASLAYAWQQKVRADQEIEIASKSAQIANLELTQLNMLARENMKATEELVARLGEELSRAEERVKKAEKKK